MMEKLKHTKQDLLDLLIALGLAASLIALFLPFELPLGIPLTIAVNYVFLMAVYFVREFFISYKDGKLKAALIKKYSLSGSDAEKIVVAFRYQKSWQQRYILEVAFQFYLPVLAAAFIASLATVLASYPSPPAILQYLPHLCNSLFVAFFLAILAAYRWVFKRGLLISPKMLFNEESFIDFKSKFVP